MNDRRTERERRAEDERKAELLNDLLEALRRESESSTDEVTRRNLRQVLERFSIRR